MIDRNSDLSISAQTKALGISRGSVCPLPKAWVSLPRIEHQDQL